MGCDMVVALGAATASGTTIFGRNSHRPVRDCPMHCLTPGRAFTLGEKVVTSSLELPQVRRTWFGSSSNGPRAHVRRWTS